SVTVEVGGQQPLSVNVRDGSGNPLNGRNVQWLSSAPAIASVTASANTLQATVQAIAPGTAIISATSEGVSSTSHVTVTALAAADVAIVDARWTQGVQQANGAIPMILDGNAAVLNVLLSTNVANRAPGQLVLTLSDDQGVTVRSDTLAPPSLSGASTYEQPSAQFLLPRAAVRAGLRWQVRRDPRGVALDANRSNDAFPQAAPALLATTALPIMRVRFVPIVLSAHRDATGNVSMDNLDTYLPTLRRTFPLGQLATSVGAPLVSSATFGTPPTGGGEGFWLQVLQDLDLARVADTSSHDTYWMGVVRPPVGFTFATFGGFSYVPTSLSSVARGTRTSTVVQTGWFSNQGQSADLVAHELAHSLGRRHAPCGGATGVDPAFPVPNGVIGTVGHDVFSWSSGLTSSAASRAATTGDLMGHCFPQWASPYTYAGLLAARLSSVPPAIHAPLIAPSRRQHVIVVRGRIARSRLTLLPSVAIDGFPTDGSFGAYRVELLDTHGRVVATHRVDPVHVDHSGDATLVAAVPLDELAAGTLTTVRIVGPDGVPTTYKASPTPSIAASSHGSSAATVELSADGRLSAVCHGTEFTAIAVQDNVSGALLASASGNRVAVFARKDAVVDISCSDGVRSRRSTLVRVTPSLR
ncbi:MAG: Ig-like domain-containing protein, partial [Gemmatimonas sp.]